MKRELRRLSSGVIIHEFNYGPRRAVDRGVERDAVPDTQLARGVQDVHGLFAFHHMHRYGNGFPALYKIPYKLGTLVDAELAVESFVGERLDIGGDLP